MKEIYKVQTPKRIVFGDPLYFEEYKGKKLASLVLESYSGSFPQRRRRIR